MMRQILPLILIISLMITFGCQESAVIDTTTTSEVNKNEVSQEEKTEQKACFGELETDIGNISSDVLVKAYYHPSCEDKMVLHSRTEKEFATGGYLLASSLCHEGKTLKVQYRKVIEPSGPVTTALAPATGEIKLPKLDNGVYRINFTLNNRTTSGNLTVSDQRIQLDIKESNVQLWEE